MDRGIAFLTEDRRAEGLMMGASIADNIALPSLPQLRRRLEPAARAHAAGRCGRAGPAATCRSTPATSCSTLVKNLSGGNQQKVVIGKWLLRGPRLFILDEPTRGIDVGAKYEVYKIINRLAAEGTGILMISSEIEELIGMCDRILVMGHGEIRGEFARGAVRPRGHPARAPCGTASRERQREPARPTASACWRCNMRRCCCSWCCSPSSARSPTAS